MFNGADIKRNLWHRSKNCRKTLRSVSDNAIETVINFCLAVTLFSAYSW